MSFPKFFSFDGSEASFIENKKSNWCAEIKIRHCDSILTLLGNQTEEPFIIKPLIGKRSLALCKSNLQKCIRRQDSDRAIRTALSIFSYNPNEILRRIIIIMIEDTLPQPIVFVKLVWWMCAISKGYKMSKTEVESMLGIIATMCETENYSVENDTYNPNIYEPFNSCLEGNSSVEWSTLPQKEKDFFYALQLRKFYGGMKIDGQMIEYHCKIWSERFSDKKQNWYKRLIGQPDYNVDIKSVDPISKDDILLESIDFHVIRSLIDKINGKYPELSKNEIQEAIWMCRSRTNFRKPITEDNFIKISEKTQQVYNIISKDVDSFCKWIKEQVVLGE